jgi:hypothetical protein
MQEYLRQVWSFAAPVLTGVGAMTVALLLVNLAFARRMRIDAWVAANPRLAGLVDLARAAGWEPWVMLRGLNRLIRGRLPDYWERVVDVVIPPPPRTPIIPLAVDEAVKKTGVLLCVVLACAFAVQACASARAGAKAADYCQTALLPLDLKYAGELLDVQRVCAARPDPEDCPEAAELERRYAELYDEAGVKCGEESAGT